MLKDIHDFADISIRYVGQKKEQEILKGFC
jgi:hypothetical protein